MGLGRVEASDCAKYLLALRCTDTLQPCQSYQNSSSVPAVRVHTADPRSISSSVAQFPLTSCKRIALHRRSTCLRQHLLSFFRSLSIQNSVLETGVYDSSLSRYGRLHGVSVAESQLRIEGCGDRTFGCHRRRTFDSEEAT